MTLTIIARTGLRCSQCSQAAQAELPPASVVEVADGGMTERLCAYHAAYRVSAAELAKMLGPVTEAAQCRAMDQKPLIGGYADVGKDRDDA